ncbi:HUTU-like protein [Mya arenaria]|uniref:HUTU-like protein n=1 Tax=Mya arenaria TaxID=6604 RepID=A0ABY7FX73_MYAAR|nr:HUTU-like protein [Mya arenaria]
MSSLKEICEGIPTNPLPPRREREENVPHAPVRTPGLTRDEERLALRNALRYFPPSVHETLVQEFADELRNYGHIYIAYPIGDYPARCRQAAALMHMIMNNLDPRFLLVMKYLSEMSDEQTLVLYSGHPAGLFPSSPEAPRAIVTNGMIFVTSGLGGMSGAQAKAAVICGCVGVIAEGWLVEVTDDLDVCVSMIRRAKKERRATSIGYHGNVVSLWERLADEFDRTGDLLADLGSDQTSCHNPYLGGYYPVQLTFEEANDMMHENPVKFKNLVQESLRRHIAAVNRLADKGMYFWDYGNAFLLEAGRAVKENVKQQYNDNIRWIKEASKNKMVVGSQARILYADDNGRVAIAVAFNKAVAEGKLRTTMTLAERTAHTEKRQIFTTDQPYMAVQNAIGDSFRGATWVALHNGGGVGWKQKLEPVVCYHGMFLMVARRSWAGNTKAKETVCRIMGENSNMKVTLPNAVENDEILDRALKD